MNDADQAHAPDATAAFNELRQEVKLLRKAVAAWVDEQHEPPDYTETLGKIVEDLSRTGRKVAWMAQRPALALSPSELAQAIKVAGEDVRAADRKLVLEGLGGLKGATEDIRELTVRARSAELQRRRLLQVGSIAGALGLLLGLLLPLAVSWNIHLSRPIPGHRMSSASAVCEQDFAAAAMADSRALVA
jgi:hypothetical protein